MPAHSSYTVVTADQISNATAFGRSMLLGEPNPDVLLATDGGGAFSSVSKGITNTIDVTATPNLAIEAGVITSAT